MKSLGQPSDMFSADETLGADKWPQKSAEHPIEIQGELRASIWHNVLWQAGGVLEVEHAATDSLLSSLMEGHLLLEDGQSA